MLLVYISGPSKSLFAMARLGFLPLFFQKTNKKGLPKNILIIQGCLFSILSILFLVMPTVQSFYQIVCQMSIILHLIMYLLLFISILVLRYKCTSVNRPFRIGKRGNLLAWIVSSLGIAGVLLAITLSFFPPQQITTGNHFTWFLIITIGTIVMVSIPFVVYKKRKSTWLHVDNNEE